MIDGFVERIERRLAERGTESQKALKARRDHQRDMILGAMGISVPLMFAAGIFAGLAGRDRGLRGARCDRDRDGAVAVDPL